MSLPNQWSGEGRMPSVARVRSILPHAVAPAASQAFVSGSLPQTAHPGVLLGRVTQAPPRIAQHDFSSGTALAGRATRLVACIGGEGRQPAAAPSPSLPSALRSAVSPAHPCQAMFASATVRMRWMISRSIGGRPSRRERRLLQRQKSRNPSQCQRTTVAGPDHAQPHPEAAIERVQPGTFGTGSLQSSDLMAQRQDLQD